jgi:hypothetical protein
MVAPVDFVGALSPACVLGHFEGIRVVFVTAELWTDRLFIRLCAVQNERTRTLDAQWTRQFERYTEALLDAAQRGEAARPEPPEQPGTVLSRVPLIVNDDAGTAYRRNGVSAGGTGSEWRAEWCFEPGVPRAATVLTARLDISDASGRAAMCRCTISRCRFEAEAALSLTGDRKAEAVARERARLNQHAHEVPVQRRNRRSRPARMLSSSASLRDLQTTPCPSCGGAMGLPGGGPPADGVTAARHQCAATWELARRLSVRCGIRVAWEWQLGPLLG